MGNGITGQIGGKGVCTGPDDPARGVRWQELAPSHTARTGKKGGIGTKDGNKPTEEHNLLAMGVEQIATDLEFPLIEPDVASIPARQGIAESVPDPKTDVVTNDRP